MASTNPVVDAISYYTVQDAYTAQLAEAERAMADAFEEQAMKADANAFADFAPLVRDDTGTELRKQTLAEVLHYALDYTNGPSITEAMQLILNAAYGNLSPEVVKAQARDLVERAGKAHARVNAEVGG